MLRVRLLECLAADQARLRQVALTDLTAAVPGCPDWNVEDLVRHVAVIYLHKVECMRSGRAPQDWPPDLSDEEPVALLDRAYRALRGEFDSRDAAAAAPTWYDPDQTVGFWIRRMAQETVIHRLDAELATGQPVADIPADLATDGIDEVLRLFLSYGTRRWPEDFSAVLPPSAVLVRVTAGPASWLIRLGPHGVEVESVPADAAPAGVESPTGAESGVMPGKRAAPTALESGVASGQRVAPGQRVASGAKSVGAGSLGMDGDDAGATASISAAPDQLLRWLWRRSAEDAVSWTGDRAAVDRLRLALGPATQ
ncbi:maleylpyruvate isomerase family mycothiol-dependent enzyme [Plantactinospora sp. S1510]|uniref:Maleylpyruvate isomerase family mycothiol-dependent enzyme n=1 Tax=Plantactinospora alkalitolerans TaxID=2789879 RepID=A0ABS0H284_9ACTN|nr:maleylpyruvate isomerase N-terminal domain-containing protein [Plantactinospora alkalitolerans]MBF9132573.1 maleylpyruvate isomerase family mycothiol-dependent enzyme [Plantactinospora alkalitolerans]